MKEKRHKDSPVFVLSKDGRPLMPTRRHGNVRRLLDTGRAEVYMRIPFTIKLTYETTDYVQEISLGIDSGSVHAGGSATVADEEILAVQCELRKDVTELISTRRECRRTRRTHLRYRKARFNNRVSTKKDGWLAPTIHNKINGNLKLVRFFRKILPISKITVEVAQFDTQKMKDYLIQGIKYQQGDQLGFFNVREYVLYRDRHNCQLCHGKSGDKVLNVHHIETRKTGGNAPNNLITLCDTCHKNYHENPSKYKIRSRGKSLRDAAYMSMMRYRVFEQMKEDNPDISVRYTFGYLTKYNRIKNDISKTHLADARVISGNCLAKPADRTYIMFCRRRHNRQIYKMKICKCGKLKRNQTDYKTFGFRLFDVVKYQNVLYYISGRRKTGKFCLKDLNNNKIEVSYKKLQYINSNNILETFTERNFVDKHKFYVYRYNRR